MIRIEMNRLSIDPKIIDIIYNHFRDAVTQAEETLIEIMGEEITQTVAGGGPGKPAWRESLSRMIRVLSTEYFVDHIESEIGQDENIGLHNYVRALLISEGGGSAGPTGKPIQAGPPGRKVWNEDLSGKHASSAQSTYLLPAGFNQPGNHFVENAMKRMRKQFSHILRNAIRSLSSSELASCIMVTKG